MRHPKRTDTHITETASFKIFSSDIPNKWIVREITERDYGIDAYIEILGEGNALTGQLTSIQLKGTSEIAWNKKGTTTFGIEIPTINYWMGLQVPVFLCVVDLTEKKTYFVNIKQQIREKYEKYLSLVKKDNETLTNKDSENFSFTLDKQLSLSETGGDLLFSLLYLAERRHDNFIGDLQILLLHNQQYLEFITSRFSIDKFSEVDVYDELMMKHIYQTCQRIYDQFLQEWPLKPFLEFYAKDRQILKDDQDFPSSHLHGMTFSEIAHEIYPIFRNSMQMTKKYVEHYKIYWTQHDPIFVQLCNQIPEQVKSPAD